MKVPLISMIIATFYTVLASSASLAAAAKVERRPFQLKWEIAPNRVSRDEIIKLGKQPIKVADHYAENAVSPGGQTSISISADGQKGRVLTISPDYKGFLPAHFGTYTVACLAEPYGEDRVVNNIGAGWAFYQFICLLDENNRGVFDKAFITKRVKTGFPEFESDVAQFLPTAGSLSYAKVDPKRYNYSASYAAFEKFVANEPTHAFSSITNVGGRESRRSGALGQSVSDAELTEKGSMAFLDWFVKRNKGKQGMFPR
jgi:hypothetical protein